MNVRILPLLADSKPPGPVTVTLDPPSGIHDISPNANTLSATAVPTDPASHACVPRSATMPAWAVASIFAFSVCCAYPDITMTRQPTAAAMICVSRLFVFIIILLVRSTVIRVSVAVTSDRHPEEHRLQANCGSARHGRSKVCGGDWTVLDPVLIGFLSRESAPRRGAGILARREARGATRVVSESRKVVHAGGVQGPSSHPFRGAPLEKMNPGVALVSLA